MTGNDARRRGRGPLHTATRGKGRPYHRCACGAEWTTAYKAQKCPRTHASVGAGEWPGEGEIAQCTP